MDSPSQKGEGKKKITEVKTFPVPFALGEVKKNITITPNTPSKPSKEQIINQAFKFHSEGKILEAAKYYQLFVNQGFKDHRVFCNYGIILKNLGKLKDAELYTRKAISLKPDYVIAHSNLGGILSDLGKLKDAELSTRKAIKLKPDYAEAHYNLGVILKDLGKLEEAEFSYRKAIELKPDYAEAYSNLGILLKDLGKLKEAEIITRKAIELKPDFAEAYSNLGTICNDLGKFDEANNNYSKAINLKPDFTVALMNRWQLLFDNGDFKTALRVADSCNTKNSRACAIETLYALGNIEEIYKRIDETLDLDYGNIRLAAFSSFISEKEKNNTSHNFCPKPLSFLYFSNLCNHLKDYLEFINELIKELNNIETVWEPSNKTTRNGFQTPTHINLFDNSSPKIRKLKSIILNELDKYYLNFNQETCSYIKKWPSKKSLVGWHVILKKQGYQKAHIHPSGWLSGVIYLKVVPSLDKDEGAIEFSLNGENYTHINSSKLTYQPELGDIVLFPSSLHHRTIPFLTDTDRIVVAFDLMPISFKP